MDRIWEYIKLIPLFVYKWADIALRWLDSRLTPLLEEFGSYYNSNMIVFIASAVILILAIVCWVIIFRKAGNDKNDAPGHLFRMAVSFVSLFLYGFVLIWIVAMLTHPLNDFGSYLLNTVFEEKAFKSFGEGVKMLPKLPDGSTITLSNFLYWHDLLAIGAVFVMFRLITTTVFSLLTFRIFKLIRFLILTLSFIVVGRLCGGFLTFLTEAGEGRILLQLLTMPVFFFAYMFPMAVVWVPVAVVYGGPVLLVLGTILNLLGIGKLNFGSDSKYVGTAEYEELPFGISKMTIRDTSGVLTGVYFFWGGGLL